MVNMRVAALTTCLFSAFFSVTSSPRVTLSCHCHDAAAAVAAPPAQRQEDVGLKDAPLRSLYPEEPAKPAPVRHTATSSCTGTKLVINMLHHPVP
jgi:hypothetical protein